jgi:arylsulfate sulfotransferase
MKYLYLLILTTFCISSCDNSHNFENTNDLNASLIDSIQIKNDTTNVLRMIVNINCKERVSLKLDYWKDGNELSKRSLSFQYPCTQISTKLIILEEDSKYWLKATVTNKQGKVEEKLSQFHTLSLPTDLMTFTNLMPDFKYSFDGFIHVGDKKQGTLYLINAQGKIVWYQPTDGLSVICSNYDPKSKTFQAILGFNPEETFTGQYIYVVDLYGNVKLKKSYTELDNPYFHHDIRMLNNGDLIIVNQIKKTYDLSKWGGSSHELVSGDGFSILDSLGNKKWAWSAFDYISPENDPNIMGGNGDYEYPPRKDWLHANAVYPCPDGNYLISFNKLSQVWKIKSQTGEIIYKLGKGGDIALDDSTDYSDRQHAASIAKDGSLMFFDNGFTNKLSRVMGYQIDEQTKKAKVTLKINLPKDDFSPNQSSAYWMDDEHVVFGSVVPRTIGITDKYGNMLWHYKTNNNFYRALYININD